METEEKASLGRDFAPDEPLPKGVAQPGVNRTSVVGHWDPDRGTLGADGLWTKDDGTVWTPPQEPGQAPPPIDPSSDPRVQQLMRDIAAEGTQPANADVGTAPYKG